jgi:glycosyltransferase involved in cell wall biosynthesis
MGTIKKIMASKHETTVLHLRSSGAMLGAENVVIELASLSKQYNIRSIIGVPLLDTDSTPEFIHRIQALGLELKVFRYKSVFSLSLAKEIKDYVKEEGIDIVHSHGYQENFYSYFGRHKAALIATNHLWKRTTFKLKIYALIDSFILRYFNHVIAVSKAIQNEMIKAGLNKNKISIVANGVNLDKFAINKDNINNEFDIRTFLNLSSSAFLFGMVSSLTVEKGHKYAIEALKNCLNTYQGDPYLVIVGGGEEKTNLLEMVKDHKLEKNVFFLGSRSDIPNLLPQFDAFMLSSLIEGLPISLLEAMASRLPVISTDVGDITTVITNNNNGFLVPSKDIPKLSEKMLLLLKDESIRKKFSINGHQTIRDNFSSNKMTKHHCDIYRGVNTK